MSWTGWPAPPDPETPNLPIAYWTGSRWCTPEWWDRNRKITFNGRPEVETKIERLVFGQRGNCA